MSETECLTLTVPDVARRLGIARGTAYRMCRRGVIPTLRIGKKVVVPKRALERLLDSAEPRPSAPAGE